MDVVEILTEVVVVGAVEDVFSAEVVVLLPITDGLVKPVDSIDVDVGADIEDDVDGNELDPDVGTTDVELGTTTADTGGDTATRAFVIIGP